MIGASLLTPLGFFGFMLLPLWFIAVGIWLNRASPTAPVRAREESRQLDVIAAGGGAA